MTGRSRAVAFTAVMVTAAFLVATPAPLQADHWWGGGFHWPRLPIFDVAFGDNTSGGWGAYLDSATATWNDTPGLQMINAVVGPGSTNAKQCRPTAGKVEVCNGSYGINGWLGLSQAWLVSDGPEDANHIHMTQVVVKFNDSYFALPEYNSADWRLAVACHETGHALGLGHRDEGTETEPVESCMASGDEPAARTLPDLHDYAQLDWIYNLFPSHPTTATNTGGGKGRGKAQVDPGDAASWGHLMADNGREAMFEAELGPGRRMVTFVLWAR